MPTTKTFWETEVVVKTSLPNSLVSRYAAGIRKTTGQLGWLVSCPIRRRAYADSFWFLRAYRPAKFQTCLVTDEATGCCLRSVHERRTDFSRGGATVEIPFYRRATKRKKRQQENTKLQNPGGKSPCYSVLTCNGLVLLRIFLPQAMNILLLDNTTPLLLKMWRWLSTVPLHLASLSVTPISVLLSPWRPAAQSL